MRTFWHKAHKPLHPNWTAIPTDGKARDERSVRGGRRYLWVTAKTAFQPKEDLRKLLLSAFPVGCDEPSRAGRYSRKTKFSRTPETSTRSPSLRRRGPVMGLPLTLGTLSPAPR